MKMTFYHKPGCINNEKQKRILIKKGFSLDERNLLEEPWDRSLLEKIFNGYLVSEWFNTSAPKIKNGSIKPELLTYSEAIDLILEDPILMRRPIMGVNGKYVVGFGVRELEILSGVFLGHVPAEINSCALVTNER